MTAGEYSDRWHLPSCDQVAVATLTAALEKDRDTAALVFADLDRDQALDVCWTIANWFMNTTKKFYGDDAYVAHQRLALEVAEDAYGLPNNERTNR